MIPFLSIFLVSSPITSCKKTVHDIIHDTLTVHVHDTTTLHVHDTTTVTDYDLVDGLVAYYNFNGGTLNDSSGYNNNIVFNSATKTTDRFGNNNNAYLFDGNSSYMRTPSGPSLNPDNITLFAIVKINGFNNNICHINQILGKGTPDNTNGFYTLRFDDHSTSCVAPPNVSKEFFYGEYGDNNPQGSDAGAGIDTSVARTGQWYKVAFTYNGIVAKLYVDGQLKDSKQKTTLFTDNSNDLFIRRNESSSFHYFFNGVIDEIRIYNRALPSGAILQLNNLKE